MLSFILRRLLLMIPTTLGVAAVVFTIYHLAPGDPATVMMGMGSGGQMGTESDSESKIQAFRIKHGLDRNPVVQFLDYIGPLNLSRDGHSMFSSPYGERKVEVVELESEPGARWTEGLPLSIDHLQATAPEDRKTIDGLKKVLLDDQAEPASWEDAGADLADQELAEVLPSLMTALYDLRLESDTRGETIARLDGVLAALTGETLAVPAERSESIGNMATIRAWFGWYYAEGGGDRVLNTGEKPWGGLLCLDLGNEMQAKTSVAKELGRRLQVTVPLSLISVLLSYLTRQDRVR